MPRENHEQGLPLALIYCESRDMLVDRVVALRETALYAPRIVRRITSSVCVRAIEQDGLRLTANFALFQTMPDRPSELFLCGRYQDRIVDEGGALRFAERLASTTRPSFRHRWSIRFETRQRASYVMAATAPGHDGETLARRSR